MNVHRVVFAVVVAIACLSGSRSRSLFGNDDFDPAVGATAGIWTGAEMLAWKKDRTVLIYDPTSDRWRASALDSPNGQVQGRPYFSLTARGTVACAYLSKQDGIALCCDSFSLTRPTWRRVATIPLREFGESKGNESSANTNPSVEIAGVAKLSDGVAVILQGYVDYHGIVRGVVVTPNGKHRFFTTANVPFPGQNPVVCSFRDKVLYYSHTGIDSNEWAVWDAALDRWSVQTESKVLYTYDYSFCQADDMVYFYGGCAGSSFRASRRVGAVYSFEGDRWRSLPLKSERATRWSLSNGSPIANFSVPDDIAFDSTYLLPLPKRDSSPLPGKNDLSPFDPCRIFPPQKELILPPVSSPADDLVASGYASPPQFGPLANHLCALCWTGEELLMWGGSFDDGLVTTVSIPNVSQEMLLRIPFAYHPQTGRWMALPSLENPPPCLTDCLTVWTGKEMIVWKKTGFAYNPRTGHWRTLPPCDSIEPEK
jgi:hypothetical protein